MIELNISGQSKHFGGSTMVYESLDVFQRFAEAINGFPRSMNDTRTFEIGSVDGKYEGGGVGLKFFCTDSLGHAAVRIQIISRGPIKESADFVLPIVAAAVDNFVNEMTEIHNTLIGAAVLQMYQE